ncbi:MAG: sulfite exporter TauE/SafE family protein [Phycisphaerales bacterium]
MIALEILGALLVGLSLGLLGAGGSIVTVPVLVFVVGDPPKVAIAESLAIVGAIAATAASRYQRQRLIDWRHAILLGVPGMLGALQGAMLARAMSGRAQMILFACVAFVAALRMLLARSPSDSAPTSPHRPAWQPILAGIAVGLLTGLVGVGGGFLLIPALVVLLGVPMRRAIGTSLVVIVANCVVGFARQFASLEASGDQIQWITVIVFAVVGSTGALAGARLSAHLPHNILRVTFAWVLVLVAIGTLVSQLLSTTAPAS